MKKKVTIQDVANELGMSRNTVSKALNGQKVPEKTRQIILNKAIVMGYKGISLTATNVNILKNKIHILIVTNKPLANLSFFMATVKGMEQYTEGKDVTLFQYMILDSSTMSHDSFNQYLSTNQISGIIGIEIFNDDIIQMILKTELPVTFIDCHRFINQFSGAFDVILMDNFYGIYELVQRLILNQTTKFGFIGDFTHCRGFYERFIGLKETLSNNGLTYNASYSITEPDYCPYGQVGWMLEQIQKLPDLPQAFVCANDSIAITVIHVLNQLNISIPNEIQVIGFDNISESEHIVPSLTTIHTPKEQLGQEAIQSVINRILTPGIPSRISYIRTSTLIRNSTK
ncbi:MAG TPA: hypothetical protein DCY20_06440 [Firmicutes bacterium]|nr:hypothetical protein [Bacillota bacterium]